MLSGVMTTERHYNSLCTSNRHAKLKSRKNDAVIMQAKQEIKL